MVENLFKFFSTKLVEVRGLKVDRVVVVVQEDACRVKDLSILQKQRNMNCKPKWINEIKCGLYLVS